MNFKRGEVYKALETITWIDPDFMNPDIVLFEKGCLYKCEKDGTLHSLGSFLDEPIEERFNDCFELVAHFTPKIKRSEIRKESMRIAFLDPNSYDFDNFYEMYTKTFYEMLPDSIDEINENEITYLDGRKSLYWDEYTGCKIIK